LQGNVVGPVVWDQVQLGGYSISFQALGTFYRRSVYNHQRTLFNFYLFLFGLAAATTVTSEDLSYNYDGILGLALPLNSIISQLIPPVTSNTPDGASFSSNLFGITPRSQAPAAHYLSLVLQRPGSDRLPSLLGVGRHPFEIVQDPSKIEYSVVVGDEVGTLFWKTYVRAITVYVDGRALPVGIPGGVKGTPLPVAVLDSGIPLIVTRVYKLDYSALSTLASAGQVSKPFNKAFGKFRMNTCPAFVPMETEFPDVAEQP
jgi:hypothetical protein